MNAYYNIIKKTNPNFFVMFFYSATILKQVCHSTLAESFRQYTKATFESNNSEHAALSMQYLRRNLHTFHVHHAIALRVSHKHRLQANFHVNVAHFKQSRLNYRMTYIRSFVKSS
jgi:hypothetical protein